MDKVRWKEKDLGLPVPDSPHAVSVCLPLWEHVVGYEENRPEVVNAMSCGYPRFFLHPSYKKLCDKLGAANAKPDEFVLALPSEKVAKQCVRFTGAGRALMTKSGVALAVVPKTMETQARAFWQHAGQIVSSRMADNMLQEKAPQDGATAKNAIKKQIAALSGAKAEDVYLFATGMAAIFVAHEALAAHRKGKSVQLGFPYIDTLKLLQKFGAGAHYVPYSAPNDLKAIEKLKDISAVFCEVPGNPLLHTIDLKALSVLLKPRDVPLVVDDTLATWLNVDLRPYADITVTSLTKFFSGVGNVMGGALVLNNSSPHYAALKRALAGIYEDLLYADDAVTLAQNGEGFVARMAAINRNGKALAQFLSRHPQVKQVYHPTLIDRDAYDAIRRPEGGYGGLLSFTMKDPERAPGVYDRLTVNKGPSLGADFTLACPYTLLAHYNELSFAAENHIEANLIRISAGGEESDDLIARFDRALKSK